MHKFLRAIGFTDIGKRDLKLILESIVDNPEKIKKTIDSEGNEFAEMSSTYASGMGIRLCGTYERDGRFEIEYYYPFFEPSDVTTRELIDVERRADRESYMGISDEISLGVTLIFFLTNVADYLIKKNVHGSASLHGARLAALSLEGKVLLPIDKTKKENSFFHYDNSERNQLISQAREGDEEAIESLTLEDMDMYSVLSRRIMNEDILSIVTSYFMPYGIESDQYSILGEIVGFTLEENLFSNEKIYCLKVECNDLIFDLCINQNDLLGQPAVGRRFKGTIWMQGKIDI